MTSFAALIASRDGDASFEKRTAKVTMIIDAQTRQSFYDALAETLATDEPSGLTIGRTKVRFTVGCTSSLAHPTTVLWQVVSSDQSEISVPESLRHSGKAEMVGDRLATMLPLLLAYHLESPVYGQALFGLDDFHNGPGLAFSSDARDGNWLIPDVEFVGNRGYENVSRSYGRNSSPWNQRSQHAFWRGSTTGLAWALPQWRDLPRIKLCEIAQTRPDLFDVGISKIVQIEPHAAEIDALGYRREPVSSENWMNYRYQIDVDGNSNAWAGYFQRLLTGSPVLKITSPHGFRQWYYGRMEPWRQYVPVEPDLSDLIEKIEWLNAHESVARMIGEEGARFARSLSYDSELRSAVLTVAAAMSGKMVPHQHVEPRIIG